MPTPSTPRFVTGPLFRHVAVMSTTSAIGLVAVFVVDLINLFYISRLGEQSIAAAVGFAGVVGFFHTSLCIGLTIGITAVVARTVGAGRVLDAQRLAMSSLFWMLLLALLIGSGTAPFLHPLLRALGATGETERLAARYLAVTVHALPLLGIGMASSALLRSVGDARGAMAVTLGAALVTAVLDPILIFGLHMGLDGAAATAVVSRSLMAYVGLRGVLRHRMLGRLDRASLWPDAKLLAVVAGPAVLTNLATPVGAAFVTHAIAQFGASAVAGQAIIDRVTPVAFGTIYALSGAVGPILAQNLGAGQFDRVREGLRASLWFMLIAVGSAWLLLALGQHLLVQAFSAEGDAAQLIRMFCSWLAASFLFAGALFVANAAFNNLGRPLWSTGFNWARATLGTIPFAWWGAQYGPVGVLAGAAIGSAIFGSLAMLVAFRLVGRMGVK
ncbi:putative MATE family efflux protein [Rhodoferax ferrireducens]|uniref:Multidrug-efflux transporter n=1 Tax=Rhodoferax ferrireducens TaxID=192843 RepID=A0ABU2CCD2_9BURK|nr:MATE family efflux transporter [Rhodoferax ferrireducens]MDR7378997.1 putative MATE family efflux protein [Rhodoferax ferrireducens]